MAQIFQPRHVLLVQLALAALLLVVVGAFLAWQAAVAQRPAIGEALLQRPPFSHKHHVSDVGLDCRFCHVAVETSAFAGMPSTATCLTCHSQLFVGQTLLAPLWDSLRTQRPLRWRRVHHLPDFVYFNHGIHVAKGVGCSSCHGQVDQMPLLWRTQSLEMRWCLDCHRAPERYLRPRERVFDMTWRPPADQLAQGRRLLVAYDIDPRRLADCSNCHR